MITVILIHFLSSKNFSEFFTRPLSATGWIYWIYEQEQQNCKRIDKKGLHYNSILETIGLYHNILQICRVV